MKRLFFLFFIFIFNICNSYEFPPGKLSITTGYRHDHFSNIYGNPKENEINSFDENIKKLNMYEFGIDFQYLIKDHYLIKTYFNYSIGSSDKSNCKICVQAIDASKSYYQNINGKINYHVNEQAIDSSILLGYQIRLGPLFLSPLIGFSYDLQDLHRRGVSNYIYQTATIYSHFSPKKNEGNQWYTSLFGVNILLYPIAMGTLGLQWNYEFHIGVVNHKTKYQQYSDVNPPLLSQTIRNIHYSIHEDLLALGHVFNMNAFIGLYSSLSIGANFSYQYWYNKNKNFSYRLKGEETVSTTSNINEIIRKDNIKIKWEMISANLSLSYQF